MRKSRSLSSFTLTIALLSGLSIFSPFGYASPYVNGEAEKELQIVTYFAKWCAPCRHEAPILNELYEEGYGVAGINYDMDDNEHTRQIVNYLGIQFPVFKSKNINIEQYPFPAALPTTHIFKNGVRVETLLGIHDKETILKYLK
ncbi:TlpA family protein disulfide reductase [Vibrio sp.]|nr:TlpA family protein disulfide reductase [Vibrio sp.]